jgi:hypothetical protein
VCRGLWQSVTYRPRIATNKITVARNATVKIDSGLPLAWPDRMYSWQPENGAWQSAVYLRADYQEVIPVVAIPGIWPRNLANDQIPEPAILHRQFPCLICHRFLTRGFLGVRQICIWFWFDFWTRTAMYITFYWYSGWRYFNDIYLRLLENWWIPHSH